MNKCEQTCQMNKNSSSVDNTASTNKYYDQERLRQT